MATATFVERRQVKQQCLLITWKIQDPDLAYCTLLPRMAAQEAPTAPHRVTPNPKPATRERFKDAAKKGRHLLSHLLPLLSLSVAPRIVRPMKGYEKGSSPIRGIRELEPPEATVGQ